MATYRVLVVDDNADVRRMVTASIKTLGAEIDVIDVPSAEEALVISASVPLDLVVLDFRLPGMTGLDMVTRLHRRRPEAKIILVTGVDDALIRQQIENASVEAYFYKPIEIDKFLEAVKRSLWGAPPEPAAPAEIIASPAAPVIAAPAPAVEVASPPAPSTSPEVKTRPTTLRGPVPTLDERLASLKQQLRAVSVLLVNDAGQVIEVAGNPSQLTSESALLTSLMDAFRASQKISQAMGRSSGNSLQYYATQRQCLYVAPVGLSHALFAITAGYLDPEKLGTIDRYFQLAVRDLQDILEGLAAEEQARKDKLERQQADLPSQVTVDQETRQLIDQMFAKADQKGGSQQADSFWEDLEKSDSADQAGGKDVLSYDQAHDLGLAPGEGKPS